MKIHTSLQIITETYVFLFLYSLTNAENQHYSMIKEIDGQMYIGGRNYLARYDLINNELILNLTRPYYWPINMNRSDIGFEFKPEKLPNNFSVGPKSLAFDTCLNWKQEHKNETERLTSFDYQHWKYHTPSGDWLTMNFTCMNSFIRSIEPLDDDTLWVCGTFGAFPQAFSVNKTTLEFIKFVDVNVMSCARYVDEPMATFRVTTTKDLYVASGWGLYRPDKRNPDVPNNNSTMLYADWRLYRNLFTLPSAMAWVLSSDVNFINVVKETNDHLYFFGHEINNQYGLNNQEDRNAWQSFMLRICKRDSGFKYIPVEIAFNLQQKTATKYYVGHFKTQYNNGTDEVKLSPIHRHIDYNNSWYDETAHLPKTHFVTPLKINFGCYIGKRPRAISDNHFWGDTNVVYVNKLADVIFDPNRIIRFRSKSTDSPFGCSNNQHHQVPLTGIFNREGLQGTNVKPTGALCQLQINQNIFNEIGSKRSVYHKHNIVNADNAYEEIMALSSTSYSSFYGRTIHRTNGYNPNSYWNQGVLIGDNEYNVYAKEYKHIGKCENSEFYKTMTKQRFLQIQNFSNIAWPNELPNRLSSIPSAICQYAAAELYNFNATFVIEGVEFKKIFSNRDNITNYIMHNRPLARNKVTSPLMIVTIISTTGHLYRVVLCDFDNGMINHGEDKTSKEWYNWCIFRHTNQPYLYRQYTPMERREWGESYQYRASSLLLNKKIVNKSDESSFPINRDPQFHIVKDVLRKGDYLHVLTSENFYSMNIEINCSRDYNTCIDCASDPDCMWKNNENKCEFFNETVYNESLFVQDVLDRGFKCATLIETKNKRVDIHKIFTLNNLVTLSCSNAELWRDDIEWRINNISISEDSGNYLINQEKNYLIILKNPENILNISCHGIRSDYDKLFNNTEYDWIIESKDLSSKLLTVYTMNVFKEDSQWSGYFIAFIVVLIYLAIALIGIVIIFVLLLFFPDKFISSSNTIRSTFGQPLFKGEYAPVKQLEMSPPSSCGVNKQYAVC